MSALIAGHFGDATEAQLSALLAAGFVLFVFTLVVNTVAAVVIAAQSQRRGHGDLSMTDADEPPTPAPPAPSSAVLR